MYAWLSWQVGAEVIYSDSQPRRKRGLGHA